MGMSVMEGPLSPRCRFLPRIESRVKRDVQRPLSGFLQAFTLHLMSGFFIALWQEYL